MDLIIKTCEKVSKQNPRFNENYKRAILCLARYSCLKTHELCMLMDIDVDDAKKVLDDLVKANVICRKRINYFMTEPFESLYQLIEEYGY